MSWLKLVDREKQWEYIFGTNNIPCSIVVEDLIIAGNSCRVRCYLMLDNVNNVPEKWYQKGYNAVGFEFGVMHFTQPPSLGVNCSGTCKVEVYGEPSKMTISLRSDPENYLVFEAQAKVIVLSDIKGFYFGL